jgi:hypothetical protein
MTRFLHPVKPVTHPGDLMRRWLRGMKLGETLAPGILRRAEPVPSGAAVCSLGDAIQDRHLDLLVHEVVETGRPTRALGHVWGAG